MVVNIRKPRKTITMTQYKIKGGILITPGTVKKLNPNE